jgi:hypothetical protein
MKLYARKLIAAAMAAALFSNATLAAESWASGTLKSVYPLSNGSFVVIFFTSPAACTNANNPRYLLVSAGENGVTAEGVKAMLATSLAAFVAGKQIQLAFDDSTSSCYINRMAIVD